MNIKRTTVAPTPSTLLKESPDVARPIPSSFGLIEGVTCSSDQASVRGLGGAAGLGGVDSDNSPDVGGGMFDDLSALAQTEVEGTHSGETRVLNLIVVRESDEQHLEMFNAMRELTYLNLEEHAAIEAIRKVGMRPWDGDFTVEWEVDGARASRTVEVTTLRHGDTKAILFEFGGVWHMWSMASAAKMSAGGYNNFTHLLIEQLQWLRPETVHVANLSRLIRSEREASRLAERGLRDNVDRIVANDLTFELSGPHAWVGFMMLTVMGWCAATERTAIVQRLLAGRIAQWRRGEWPLGPAVVPFGYFYDKKLKCLMPDETQRSAVREMMLVLISDGPPALKAAQLDRIGVRGFRKNPRGDRYLPFAARKNPAGAIETLMQWASIWVSGEYLCRFTNTLDLDELSGLRVARFPGNEEDPGEFQMLFKVGVPTNGWCEPDILDAFARKAITHSSELLATKDKQLRPLSAATAMTATRPELLRGLASPEALAQEGGGSRSRRHAARARQVIQPLVGRNWITGDWFYELHAGIRNTYRILRWPLSTMDPSVDREIRIHGRDGDS